MSARHIAMWLPAVLPMLLLAPRVQASGPKAGRVQPESKMAAVDVAQRFGVHAYSIVRQGNTLRVNLLRNDRQRQGTYILDETNAPTEREERFVVGATTFVSLFHDDGEQSYVTVRDNQEEATITLDKSARQWTGDTEAALRIAKRNADAMALIEAIQVDLSITPRAPVDPARWSSKRQGSVGARPMCEPAASADGAGEVTVNLNAPNINCSDIFFCRGWGYHFRHSMACQYSIIDSAECCTNAICIGCCNREPCDCLCGIGDFYCYCTSYGASCTYGPETN